MSCSRGYFLNSVNNHAFIAPQSLSISFGGSEYPHPSNSTPVNQVMNITFICNREATDTPKFISYDGVRLVVEWTTPAGCYSSGEDKPPGDKPVDDGKGKEQPPHENVGSGVGWFFLMYVLHTVTKPLTYLGSTKAHLCSPCLLYIGRLLQLLHIRRKRS